MRFKITNGEDWEGRNVYFVQYTTMQDPEDIDWISIGKFESRFHAEMFLKGYCLNGYNQYLAEKG